MRPPVSQRKGWANRLHLAAPSGRLRGVRRSSDFASGDDWGQYRVKWQTILYPFLEAGPPRLNI